MVVAYDVKERSKVTEVFKQAQMYNLTIVRTWAFNDNPGNFSLQSSPGVYDQTMFQAVLTRNNTISGVVYKDDPTIMAWELMNEPRCPSDVSGNTLKKWIAEMAGYLKSIDANHLLEVGLEGFYNPSNGYKNQGLPYYQVGTDFISKNQIPEIDF
ncbi:unnamed protein product, partial [Cuscuta epithymum]